MLMIFQCFVFAIFRVPLITNGERVQCYVDTLSSLIVERVEHFWSFEPDTNLVQRSFQALSIKNSPICC